VYDPFPCIRSGAQQKVRSTHAHQRLEDARAASAARYSEDLCNATCRGIVKEKMKRGREITAVGKIRFRQCSRYGHPAEDNRRRKIGIDDVHEKYVASTPALSLCRLVKSKPRRADVSEALACGDLIGIRWDAGQFVEARQKETD